MCAFLRPFSFFIFNPNILEPSAGKISAWWSLTAHLPQPCHDIYIKAGKNSKDQKGMKFYSFNILSLFAIILT